MKNTLNRSFEIYNYKEHYVNTNNGILNQDNIEFAKKTFLFDTVRNLVDEFVKTKQHYPENDVSLVEMEIDCVLISKEEYSKLIKENE